MPLLLLTALCFPIDPLKKLNFEFAFQLKLANRKLNDRLRVKVVKAFWRLSKGALIGGSDLLLSGFGKFNVRDKGVRRGRNPQTGDELALNSRRVVTFKPSGILRDIINGE